MHIFDEEMRIRHLEIIKMPGKTMRKRKNFLAKIRFLMKKSAEVISGSYQRKAEWERLPSAFLGRRTAMNS